MGKIKTHKATVKRLTKTRNKKIKITKGGQNHFNARESGNTTRGKRRNITAHESVRKVVRTLMPYNY